MGISAFSNSGVNTPSKTANFLSGNTPVSSFTVEYLVIAGGGAGGANGGGGGGAGGYRTNVTGQLSGRNSTAESPLELLTTLPYVVTVGVGGTHGSSGSGSDSQFSSIVSIKGGFGGGRDSAQFTTTTGGSGGGGAGWIVSNSLQSGGAGTTNQGFAGGNGTLYSLGSNAAGGGGGGAGAAGGNAASATGGIGGNGVSSDITGTAVVRAGGGGGGKTVNGTAGAGGSGGGGTSSTLNGVANTGSGGMGGSEGTPRNNPGNGGSGVVILRYPDTYEITFDAGLTGTTAYLGSNKVTTFTSGTGNVNFKGPLPSFSTVLNNSASTGLLGQIFTGGDYRASLANGEVGGLPFTNSVSYQTISYTNLGSLYGFLAIGYFKPPTTGTYTFFTSSDDSSAVWVGDIAAAAQGRTAANAVVNNGLGGGGQGDTKRSGTISLIAGTWYPIRIVHEEGGGGDNLTFSWSGPSIAETTSLSGHFKPPVNLAGQAIQTFYELTI